MFFRRNAALPRIVICVLLVAFSAPAMAADPPVAARLDALFTGCDDPSEPGGFGVAILKDGAVVFKKGYGHANTEHGAPFTTATPFDFASVAKQFTGLAIAMLATQGRLSLDDDIRKYLPEIHDFGTPITIRHLLYHTSGLRDWVALVKLSGRSEDDLIDGAFLRRLAFSQRELNFPPGEEHLYSNLGYFLLAEIVEKVTGERFAQWMRSHVFEPLEMHDTFIVEEHDAVVPGKAYSYAVEDGGETRALRNGLVSPGSSSLISTVDDMVKWVRNLETGGVGGDGPLGLVLTRGSTNEGQPIDYGFGIGIYDYRGQRIYDHGGSWRGFVCQVQRIPEQSFAYIFVANRNPSGCYVMEDVWKLVLGDQVMAEPGGETAETETQAATDGVQHEAIAGRYARDLGHTYSFVTITSDEDGTHYQRDAGSTRTLTPEGDSGTRFTWRDFEFVFDAVDGGTGVELTVQPSSGDSRTYRRVPDYRPSVEQLAEYSGRYHSEELHTSYELVIEETGLVLRHFQNGDVTLVPQLPDYFTTDQWWISDVRINRDEAGRVVGLRVAADNGSVRGVRMRRMPASAP